MNIFEKLGSETCLKEAGLTEGLGRMISRFGLGVEEAGKGIPKVFQAYTQAGKQTPEAVGNLLAEGRGHIGESWNQFKPFVGGAAAAGLTLAALHALSKMYGNNQQNGNM